MEKALGILGGMGPMATADLFTKIVSLTKADCDNDHIRVYIDSNARIPDRTKAILYGGENPLPYMIESAKKLEQIGADVLIMPCNTAHYYFDELTRSVGVPFLHLIEEAAKLVPQGRRPGLLATTATAQTGLYARAVEKYGFELIVPDEEHQALCMDCIHDVKAGRVPDRAVFASIMQNLRDRGADIFIMGCTEIPLIFEWLALPDDAIDATEALARAAIRYCGKEVKE